MLDFTFTNHLKNVKTGKNFFLQILEKAAIEVGLNQKQIGLSLNLTGEAKMRALNRKHRGGNQVADVLSFPIGAKVDKSDTIELGDVFICFPAAARAALKEKVGLEKKLAVLAVHGFLHLLGYVHEKSGSERKMFVLQKKILKGL